MTIDQKLAELELKSDLSLETQTLLEKNRAIGEPYLVRYKNKLYTILADVFAPDLFGDTYFFMDSIQIAKNQNFLEIGCGSGLISVNLAISGCNDIVACDISPVAVKNTLLNAKAHNVLNHIQVFESDVYSALPEDKKFDVIFWNLPFICSNTDPIDALEACLYDKHYSSLHRFVRDAHKFLTDQGQLLLGFSPTKGSLNAINLLAEEYSFSISCIAEKVFPNGCIVQIIKLLPKI